jgi:hypothetical protein
MTLFSQKKSKIIIFSNERKMNSFVTEFKKHLKMVYFSSEKFQYPLVILDNRLVVIATLDEVSGISLPFDLWIFFEIDSNLDNKIGRSDGQNIFLQS